jgi:hypothetical protein
MTELPPLKAADTHMDMDAYELMELRQRYESLLLSLHVCMVDYRPACAMISCFVMCCAVL